MKVIVHDLAVYASNCMVNPQQGLIYLVGKKWYLVTNVSVNRMGEKPTIIVQCSNEVVT